MNPASEMAKRRWDKLTSEERSEYAAELGRKRMAGLTAAERTKLAMRGVKARRRKAKA